jgi:hypothetical protein
VGPAAPPGAPDDAFSMSPQELAKYEMLFSAYDSDGDGFVTGAEAVTLFTRSGLSRSDLKVVWDMAGTHTVENR